MKDIMTAIIFWDRFYKGEWDERQPTDTHLSFAKAYAQYYARTVIESLTDDEILEYCTYENDTGGVFIDWKMNDTMTSTRNELLKRIK